MKNSPIILMYHGIKTNSESIPEGREVGAELYDLPLDRFESQMNWLSANGYHTGSIEDFNHSDQEKQVILTFDDGEMNNFTHALPILKRLNFKAYFFIIVDRIGQPGYMGWDELHQLQNADMMIGSHSLTHPILTDLEDHQVKQELDDSLQCLVNHLGNQVSTLSIPRGFCNNKVIQIAYAAGYQNVFISERPEHLKIDCWERIAVKAYWHLQRFQMAIDGEKPIGENVADQAKKIAKKLLKGKTYNHLRSSLINLKKQVGTK